MNTLDKLIKEFSVENLSNFLRTSIPSFKPDNEELDYLFPENIYDKYEVIVKIGEAEIDNDDLIVIACKTNEPLTERTGKKNQYEIAKKILKNEVKDASLFVFYDDEGNFRFSFVKANYLGTRRDFTDFKRYTYFVTPKQTNKTFIKQVGGCNFDSLDEIVQAFSVEPLNKQFYQDIAKSFYGLIGGKVKIGSRNVEFDTSLQLPSISVETNRKVYQEFGVRLIGRTIFCWFLKSKKSKNSIPLVPDSWLSSKTVVEANNQQHNYYHSVLEKLFFLVLNKKQEDRKDYELPKDHVLIPFLNGGLFEAQTDDFFSTNSKGIHQIAYNLIIPNQWFIELFEVLEQYNFTIDENSIYDAEVSIDPEMLGTIFENLLAEIDPDTEKSARKATGSFYTPREIVDYMVEQSLVQYLKTKINTDKEENLLELFKEGGKNNFDNTETIEILEALSSVKILDPACGSGAFPMGALHKIINALHKLDPDASWWKDKQIKNVPNALAKKMLKEKLDGESADYVRKLGVIQNSIYGVDIQPIASEISKLRSFLSLVIDETIIDDAENRGIQALPNLEFKFVTANTLIGLEEKDMSVIDFGQTDQLQDQLKTIRNQYLQAYGEDKKQLKKDFEEIQTKIFKQEIAGGGLNKRALQLSSWNPFSNESNEWFDPYWMYGVEKFDIVIGNPPWGAKLNAEEKALYKLIYDEIDSSTPNSFAYFCGIGLTLTDNILTFVLPDSILIKDFQKTRKLLKENINEISWYLNTGVPDNYKPFVYVEHDVCVLILNKAEKQSNCKIIKHLYNSDKKNTTIDEYELNKNMFILEQFNHNYNLIIKNEEIKLLNRFKDLETLESRVQIHEGIHTGNSRDILFHNLKINDFCKPLYYGGRAGDQIKNFVSNMAGWFVDYRKEIIDKDSGFYASLRDEKIFKYPKLYITRTGNPIKVFYDKNSYASNNFFSLQLKNYDDNTEENLKLILPLILSSFSNYYIRTYCAPRLGDTYVETKIIHLLKIPLPRNLFENENIKIKFNYLVNNIITSINKGIDYDAEMDKIDLNIYKLYELSHSEVLTIDPQFNLTQQEYDNYKV